MAYIRYKVVEYIETYDGGEMGFPEYDVSMIGKYKSLEEARKTIDDYYQKYEDAKKTLDCYDWPRIGKCEIFKEKSFEDLQKTEYIEAHSYYRWKRDKNID